MSEVQAFAALTIAFCGILVAVIGLIGKIVNQQVNKSFEHSVNGDSTNSVGMRTGLKELRADVKALVGKVDSIAENTTRLQESMKNVKEACVDRHADINRRLNDLREVRHE